MRISRQKVKEELDYAMGVHWSDSDMESLTNHLQDRFPTWRKTINRVMNDAGTASNERSEGDADGPLYDKLWHSVMNRIDRMYKHGHKPRGGSKHG